MVVSTMIILSVSQSKVKKKWECKQQFDINTNLSPLSSEPMGFAGLILFRIEILAKISWFTLTS